MASEKQHGTGLMPQLRLLQRSRIMLALHLLVLMAPPIKLLVDLDNLCSALMTDLTSAIPEQVSAHIPIATTSGPSSSNWP